MGIYSLSMPVGNGPPYTLETMKREREDGITPPLNPLPQGEGRFTLSPLPLGEGQGEGQIRGTGKTLEID